MRIHSGAEIPLKSESLPDALCEFTAFLRRHLSLDDQSEAYFGLAERGARGNELLARNVPDEIKGFHVEVLPLGRALTAAQFRDSIKVNKPNKTNSRIRIKASAVQDLFSLIDGLAGALPQMGRGIILVLGLSGLRFPDGDLSARFSAKFSHYHHGVHTFSATVGLDFYALSLKDPVVAKTVVESSRLIEIPLGKPTSTLATSKDASAKLLEGAANDERLMPASPEQLLVVMKSFDEALARAADQVDARPEDLERIPMLFAHSIAFQKRLDDVMARKKENINLQTHLKRLMKGQFPDYCFDEADPEQVWFRKTIAPTLDLLLMFDKVYFSGLGKAFGIEVAADFPNTPFGGMHVGRGASRRSLFWMFHQELEQRVWAYTTSDELSKALEGCAVLLRRVLHALEEQCQKLLVPPPRTLASDIEKRGALSAREAFTAVLPVARQWAADAELLGVASSDAIQLRDWQVSARTALGEDGRLTPQGSWGFRFASKARACNCYYLVPHTGRVWWNFHSGGIPQHRTVVADDDWADSTIIAPPAFNAIRKHLGEFRPYAISLALGDPATRSETLAWSATCMAYDASVSDRRDIAVQLDRRTGEVLKVTTR